MEADIEGKGQSHRIARTIASEHSIMQFGRMIRNDDNAQIPGRLYGQSYVIALLNIMWLPF